MQKNITLVLAAALAMHWYAVTAGQEAEKAQTSLYQAQDKLSRVRLMLQAYESRADEVEKHNASLAVAAAESEKLKERLGKIEDELQQQVAKGFSNLKPVKEIKWQVAPDQKAFLPALPPDLTIVANKGVTRITKTGNPPNLPVGPSPTYAVGPTFELRPGDRALLRISLPTVPSRGGTPVPYFGVRDAKGAFAVVAFIGDSKHDGKIHEIRIQCTQHEAFAFFDGSLQVESTGTRDLQPPLQMVFHMNDTSELLVHEVQLSSEPK